MGLRTRVLACSAVLTAIVLVAVPGGRSFAANVATRIAHLRSPATAGPIPFILDLQKHKRTRKAPASRPQAPVTRGHTNPKAHAAPPAQPAAPAPK
jgi:hypothetical protein